MKHLRGRAHPVQFCDRKYASLIISALIYVPEYDIRDFQFENANEKFNLTTNEFFDLPENKLLEWKNWCLFNF